MNKTILILRNLFAQVQLDRKALIDLEKGIARGDIASSIDKFGASFTMSGSNFNIPLDTEAS